MTYLPYVILAVVVVGLILFSSRARRRQAQAHAELVEGIEVGSEVMTTSGLYATVVAKSADGTVQLSIAPGIEVRWELAALREVASLAGRFADPADAADGEEPKQEQDHA